MQFLITTYHKKSGEFEILGDEAFHIAKVLRKKAGDSIRLFDGKDTVFWGEIQTATPARVAGKILNLDGICAPGWPHAVTLYQALPKGAKWDWVLQKGCEVGVSSFVPVISKRTVVAIKASEAQKKVERWRRVIAAAAKQCGMPRLPEVSKPLNFQDAIGAAEKNDLILFAWESELAKPLWKVLGADAEVLPKSIALFIGPEGGWDLSEVEQAKSAGFELIGLGPQVLRAETAPIVAVSMIHALFRTENP